MMKVLLCQNSKIKQYNNIHKCSIIQVSAFIHSFIHILSVLSLWYHWFGFLLCCHCRDINDNSRKIIRDDVTITNIIRELYGTSGVKSNRWWAWHSTFQSSGITSLVNSTNFSKGQAGIQPGMVKRYGSWIDEFR